MKVAGWPCDCRKSTPQKCLNKNRGPHPKEATWKKAIPAQSTQRKQVAQDTAQTPTQGRRLGKRRVMRCPGQPKRSRLTFRKIPLSSNRSTRQVFFFFLPPRWRPNENTVCNSGNLSACIRFSTRFSSPFPWEG